MSPATSDCLRNGDFAQVHLNQVPISPTVAAKIATVVTQPNAFNAGVFTHRPMILRLRVISMISNIKTGVETP